MASHLIFFDLLFCSYPVFEILFRLITRLVIFTDCVRAARFDAHEQVGTTALMSAAQRAHAECVRVLLEAGANKHATDKLRCGVCFARDCVLLCLARFD